MTVTRPGYKLRSQAWKIQAIFKFLLAGQGMQNSALQIPGSTDGDTIFIQLRRSIKIIPHTIMATTTIGRHNRISASRKEKIPTNTPTGIKKIASNRLKKADKKILTGRLIMQMVIDNPLNTNQKTARTINIVMNSITHLSWRCRSQ